VLWCTFYIKQARGNKVDIYKFYGIVSSIYVNYASLKRFQINFPSKEKSLRKSI